MTTHRYFTPKKRPILVLPILGIAALAIQLPTASAALIAGSDFSNSSVFNASGGTIDKATDDLNLTDNVTVGTWVNNASGGSLTGGLDPNAQTGMPNDVVSKIDGKVLTTTDVPALTDDFSDFWGVSFSIVISAGTQVDLSSVTFDWRKATGDGPQVRWLAFNTSLDGDLLYSQNGVARNGFVSADIDLSGALYQGLTDQTVTFNWYAGGQGSGDIDFDTVIVNGTVTQVPEPSAIALFEIGAVGFLLRRRR